MKYLKLILLFGCIGVNAQEGTIKWAEKIKTRGNVELIGGFDGSYFTVNVDNESRLNCRKYNNEMKIVEEKIAPIVSNSDRFSFNSAIFLNKKILFISQEKNRKEDKESLVGSFSDFKLNKVDKSILLDEYGDDDDVVTFGNVYQSIDSTKILVVKKFKSRKKEPSKLAFKLYDNKLNSVLLDKTVEIPIKDKNFVNYTLSVDNLGNIYLLAIIKKEKKEITEGQSDFYHKVIIFDHKTAEPKELDFAFENKTAQSFAVLAGENNTMICAGFLCEVIDGFFSKKNSKSTNEIFTTVIDCKTKNIISKNTIKVEDLYPENGNNRDKIPYYIRDIHGNKDGSFDVIAEQYKYEVHRNSVDYFYCDIAYFNIDKNNNLKSVVKIPKFQKNVKNPSIISTFANNKTYIIYEDLTKNVDATNDKETKRTASNPFTSNTGNSIFLVNIDKSGKFKKEILYDFENGKIRPKILTSRVINPKTIILNADDQIGLLKLK